MKLGQNLLKLKEQAEKANKEAIEAGGQMKQIEKTLKEEFKCGSIEEAEELAEQLQEEIGDLTEEVETAIAAFMEDYGFI